MGGAGDDILIGGKGADTLTGGLGDDSFRLLNFADGGDTILDFNKTTEADTISIVKSGFGVGVAVNHGAAGVNDFDAHYFVTDQAATKARGRFLFDTAAHTFSWDSNGTAAGGITLIATFTDATLHTSDFHLI